MFALISPGIFWGKLCNSENRFSIDSLPRFQIFFKAFLIYPPLRSLSCQSKLHDDDLKNQTFKKGNNGGLSAININLNDKEVLKIA